MGAVGGNRIGTHVCYTFSERLTKNIGWFALGIIFMGALSMVTR